MTTFAVVTKTDPHDYAGVFDLAFETDEDSDIEFLKKNKPLTEMIEEAPTEGERQVLVGVLLNARRPVFDLGEVLLLDDSTGREVDGPGRKPSKWFVTTEEFDTLDAAIERSREVRDQSAQDALIEAQAKKMAGL